MTARVLIVKNSLREGPGLLRDVLMQHRIDADVVDVERGESIPELDGYGALIVLGGPPSANDETPAIRMQLERASEALESGLPYLGVCLGHQILGKAAGAQIEKLESKEIGFHDEHGRRHKVTLTDAGKADPIFDGLPETFVTFQLHGEAVVESPGITTLASSWSCPVQAMCAGRHAYGVQMHVELVPEMLAVWCAQDPDLRHLDAVQLQKEYAAISDSYLSTGRRFFNNFLSAADLTSIDLTESERADVH